MHLAASGVAFNTWCLQREQNCIRPAGGMDALKGSRKLLSGSGFPVRSINDSSCSRVQTEICSQLLGFIEQGYRAAARSLLAFLTESRCLVFCFLSLFCFQYFQTTGPFILWVSDLFLSDIVVRCFAERLPQSDLQGHEGAHRHVKEDLPDVPQFVQIHVGKTDECKGQEGLAVPPDWEVGKQVALKGERERERCADHMTGGNVFHKKSHLISLCPSLCLPVCGDPFSIRSCTKKAEQILLEKVLDRKALSFC